MMIQSISATRAAAASGESSLPVAARASQGGQATAGRAMADDAMRGFGERMLLASTADQDLASQLADPSLQGALPVLTTEPGQALRAGGSASQGSETPQELTPEQWLLGMLDQQLAAIQARDAQAGNTSGPVPRVLSDSVTSAADDVLIGLPGQAQFPQAVAEAAPVDPLATLMSAGVQRGLAEVSPLVAAMSKPGADMGVAQPAGVAVTSLDATQTTTLDSLLDAVESLEPGEPMNTAAERGQAAPLQSADRALKLQAPEAKWGEQMLHALRENVDLQIQQKIQSATIRLDPPELGSMEILLSHESGRLSVQLSAANADVARLLQQTSDRLRQELVGQHFVQVNVQVGADGGGQQGQPRQRPVLAGEEAPLAARPQEQEPDRDSRRPRDVLVTV
ncbi:flagellar hook-length control protein FliK [Stutzerimonas stutzeri]|uniref:flagellar hook-length control protein FliK n=2 Tax=Pseudomonadaceae TaxID=135621 RepID=UPI003DA1184A